MYINSFFNSTDGTFHIKQADEEVLATARTRIAMATLWLGVLGTVGIALALSSTGKQKTQRSIIILQCTSFSMAIVYNILVDVRGYWKHDGVFRMPGEQYNAGRENRVQVACLVLEHWIPLLANSAILSKLAGFYPPLLFTLRQRVIRMAPLVLLLATRTILVSYLTYITHELYEGAASVEGQAQQVLHRRSINEFTRVCTVTFLLEALFCLCVTGVLLYKITSFYRGLKQMGVQNIRRKLRLFLELCSMTFIPPLVLSIVCIYALHGSPDHPSIYRETVSALVNCSVVCSLLVTSWSSIRDRQEGDAQAIDETSHITEHSMAVMLDAKDSFPSIVRQDSRQEVDTSAAVRSPSCLKRDDLVNAIRPSSSFLIMDEDKRQRFKTK